MRSPIPFLFLTPLLFLLSLPSSPLAAEAPPTPGPAPPSAHPRRLLFAAELCRHGDRTPLAHFPADALPAPLWPRGIGQLTAIGEHAHYLLGARLRTRYVTNTPLLSPVYNRSEIHVRSTDIDRTLTSAVSQLSGLYPAGTSNLDDVRTRFGGAALTEDNAGLPHRVQPVPVHTVPVAIDPLLIPGGFCPRHDAVMEEKRRADAFVDVERREARFLKEAARIAGAKEEKLTLLRLEKLHDTWRCFRAHEVPLPENATDAVVKKARDLSDWLLTYGNQGREVQRLRSGLLLFEVLRYMGAAYLHDKGELPEEDESFAKKFVLFSAHDTTVAAALSALRAFDNHNPPYNSTLIWELFEEPDESLSVRLEYNGNPLALPGCSQEYCPMAEYIESTRERTVFGPLAREVECLVGWRRRLSMVSPMRWVRSSQRDPLLAALGTKPEEDGDGAVPIVPVLAGVVALVVAIIGICGIARVRSRYRGYTPTASDGKDPNYGITQDSMTEQRILM